VYCIGCSAPANIVPRRLMGIQPLATGFSHFEALPQPGGLAWAALSLPTVHGKISLRFNQTGSVFAATLMVPNGTTARVCLPPPTNSDGSSPEQEGSGKLTVDGSAVSTITEGRMLCAPASLAAGSHTITRQ
jgi:hypothetical protein